jgi:hypothetical protein
MRRRGRPIVDIQHIVARQEVLPASGLMLGGDQRFGFLAMIGDGKS